MNKPKVTSGLTITLDGYGASHNQTLERPFGDTFDAQLLDRHQNGKWESFYLCHD